ncbi:MAG TPA: response regulator transcription factor [Candidatus Saccharimonadales bacterium]|nr:response regulator transcription factor [Candidatus Saccharimonadales bacterium]
MKLLCIEDNSELVESLRRFLAAGSAITHTDKGREGLRLAKKHQYDAVILDLGLPDLPGHEVCLRLRRHDLKVPILVLSGDQDTSTKVTLFEAGADDYLTKPFTIAELRARLFALLKRTNHDPALQSLYALKVGNLTLDPLSRQVQRSGKPIRLRPKEFDILEYLMRNRGKIVTRSMIMDNVWESGSVSWDGTVNVHIKRLRDQIDRTYKRKLIKTAYGLGYTINDRA